MTTALSLGTDATKTAFAEAFKRLALSFHFDATPEKADAYWQALSDVPIEALDAAVRAIQREKGRKFFPSTGEWREVAERAVEARLKAAVHARAEPWHLDCAMCEDTGWQLRECSAAPSICGRPNKHAPHGFAVVCPCRPTNRTYIRTRAFGAGAS